MSSFMEDKEDAACCAAEKPQIELVVKPVGYDDPNFDKFEYFKTIGSWEMAEQLFKDASIKAIELNQLLGDCKKALEWYAQCKSSKPMIDKEGNIFEFADKAKNALTRINEVLK